ncbi:MAG: MarR family winged helix-turn-helix transcriptional regulator [Brevundimonas sp.]
MSTLLSQPQLPTGNPSPGPSAHLELLRAMESLTRTLRETGTGLARDVDCSRATLAVIRTLDANGPMAVGDIAHLLRVDISVASRHVSLMADDGYVERQVDPTDRRVRTIALSERGQVRTREIEAALEARTRTVFDDWTEPELDEAIAVLRRLAATVGSAGDHPDRHTTPA